MIVLHPTITVIITFIAVAVLVGLLFAVTSKPSP